MLDLQELQTEQVAGVHALRTLKPDERTIIENYAQIATQAVMELAKQHNAPAEDMALNGYMHGLAMGLRLNLVQGELQKRS